MKELTPKQERVFGFLVEFMKSHGYPPTVREIGEHFGFLWAAARGHLRALEKKGRIKINPSKSRAIEITALRPPGGFAIAVAGRVRAGAPILAIEDAEQQLLIDKSLFPAEDAFALKIAGDSMKEAGILDGDYVIVKPRNGVGNGEIGVLLIGDESTVKRIYVRKGLITLKPENSEMEAVTYTSSEVTIVGKVIGVMRKV